MLKILSSRWPRAVACHAVLSELLDNVKTAQATTGDQNNEDPLNGTSQPPPKRRRRNAGDERADSQPYEILSSQTQNDGRESSTARHTDPQNTSNVEVLPSANDLGRSWTGGYDPRQSPSNQFHGSIASPRLQDQQSAPRSGHRTPMFSSRPQDNNVIDLQSSDFYQNLWPQSYYPADMRGSGEGLDFMVWDSLQQLVTNFE
jgi:hypothetical protein